MKFRHVPLTSLVIESARAVSPDSAPKAVFVYAPGAVPRGSVGIDQSPLGHLRVWLYSHRLEEVLRADDVTAGQIAAVLVQNVPRSWAAMLAQEIFRAARLARENGEACPFCRLTPHSPTCIIVKLRKERVEDPDAAS